MDGTDDQGRSFVGILYIGMESDCLYPKVPTAPNDEGHSFRLQKICDIQTTLKSSIAHYEGVRKKYTRSRAILNGVALTTGSLSVILSASGLAASLTGLGIVVGVPLGAIGGIFGIVSASMVRVSKRIAVKISKHERTVAIGETKLSTIDDLVSKALQDNQISATEFQLILSEVEKYETLKREIKQKAVTKNEHLDLTKLRTEIRSELVAEMREKLA